MFTGKENEIADFGSKYPRTEKRWKEFPIQRPSICHISRKVQEKLFDIRDPEVDRIPEMAESDLNYNHMIDHIINRTPISDIEAGVNSRKLKAACKIYLSSKMKKETDLS